MATKGKLKKFGITGKPLAYIFGLRHNLVDLYEHCSHYDPWVQIDPARGQVEELAIFTPRDISFTVTDLNRDTEVDDSEVFDDEFDNLIKCLDVQDQETHKFTLPEDFQTYEIMQSFKHESELSATQYNINSILNSLNERKMEIFFKKEFLIVSKLLDDLHIYEPRAVKSKELVEFYKGIMKHLSSLEYKMNCLSLFDETCSDDHMRVCFRAHLTVRKYLLKQQANLYASENFNLKQRYVTEPSKAKIRYVGGYCIAKLTHSYLKQKSNHCFKRKAESQDIFHDCNYALALLNNIKQDDTYCSTVTAYPSSLVEISRKQNVSRSLTNITDDMYVFFTELTESALSKLSSSSLKNHKQDLFNVCIFETVSNLKLKGLFSDAVLRNLCHDSSYMQTLIKNAEKQSMYVAKLYEKVIKKYLMVFFCQFGKDLKSNFHVEKKMAHRKQIQVSKLKQEKKAVKLSKFITQGQCASTSTYREVASTSKAPEPSTSANDASISAEGTFAPDTTKKRGKAKSTHDLSESNTSNQKKSHSKKRSSSSQRKQKKCEKRAVIGSYLNDAGEMVWVCPACGVEDDGSEKMIGCDICDEWFHWDCVGIEEEPEEDMWCCPNCDYCEKKRKRKKKT